MSKKIIFFGTPHFAAIILKKLISSSYRPQGVVTQPDKKVGRKQKIIFSPVKKLAVENNLPLLQFSKLDEKAILKIKELEPDLIVVAAYGKFLPSKILTLPKFGAINIHPSLLPKYRGPSPVQAAILNDEKETGVSIIKMTEKMDAGPLLAQKSQIIYNQDNAQTLSEKLANLGGQLLLTILPKIFEKKIRPLPQDETKATYTKILKKEDGKINWHDSAKNIERKVRAFYPWPGTYSYFHKNNQKKRIKITEVSLLNPSVRCAEHAKPGDLFQIKKEGKTSLAISCGQGSLILKKIQIEGKKEISGDDFILGYREVTKFE